MEWWFIRHGYTAWNLTRRYQGHSDPGLLPGAEAGLDRLPGELADVRFRAVYCSDLLRCRETLARVRPELASEAIYDCRLREMNFGDWEGQTYEQLKDIPAYRSWVDDPALCPPPGGESWEQFENRVTDFFEELKAEAGEIPLFSEYGYSSASAPILIITHGGVISLMAGKLASGSHFHDPAFKIAPGEVLRLQVRPI